MKLGFIGDGATIDAIARLAESLLHFVWQGAVLAVIAMMAARCLRGHSAPLRYAVHVATLLLMLACVPVTYCTLQLHQSDYVGAAAGAAERSVAAAIVETTHGGTAPAHQDRFPANGKRHEDRSDRPPIPRAEVVWAQLRSVARFSAPYAATAYLFGVVLMLARLAVALTAGHRLRLEARPVIETDLLSMVSRQARRVGLRTAPIVAWCTRTSVPLVAGLLKPMILLPVGLASGLAKHQLEALLAHELAHVQRFDLLVNLLQRLAEALLFFHPAVWSVSRWISSERENCCDDSVLRAGWGRLEYADALVRMAELSAALRGMGGVNSAALLAAAGDDPSQFKQRILRLFDDEERLRLGLSRGGALAILCIAVAGVLAIPALDRAPALFAQTEKIPRVETPAGNEQQPVIPPNHYPVSFRETPWRDVLRWYGRVMNQNIVLNVVPPGNVSYDNPRPLNHSEIIQLINGELLRQGYCFVGEGDGLSVQPADVIARTYEDTLRKDFMHGNALRKGTDTFESYFEIVDCRVVGQTNAPAPPGPAIAYVLKAGRDFSAEEATQFWRSCMPDISITSLKTGQPLVADGFAVLYNGKWLGTTAPPLRNGERIEVWQNRFEEWNARPPADLHVMIEGRIVSQGGNPVAGHLRQFLMEGVPEGADEDLGSFLNWAYGGELIVDKQGKFQVALRHGTQFVRTAYLYAYAPGYAPQRVGPIAVGYEKAAVPLTIELKPGFSAPVRLVRADGTPLDRGEVEVAAQDDLQAPGTSMAKLPIDGKPISVMNCPSGPLMLTVRVPGFAEQVVRDVRLTADQLAEVTVPALPQKAGDKPAIPEEKPADPATE